MKRNLELINEMHPRSYGFLGGMGVASITPQDSDPILGRR